MSTKYITLTDLRPHLPEIAKRIDSLGDRFIITRMGEPTFIFLSLEDYSSLLETAEIMQDRKLMRAIKKARKEKGGRKLEKLEKELGA